ncbi:MAG TPA: primary-amine oxidase [Myxococcota bacterium]|nr:primary-amine oxidase [Myxococcota bacterium]
MRFGLYLFCIFVLMASASRLVFSLHPLAPLTESEMKKAVQVLKENKLLGDGWYLQLLQLEEPTKIQVLSGEAAPREALAVVIKTAEPKSFEVAIDLAKGGIKKTPITRGQPAILTVEYNWAEKATREDQRVIKALKKRGIDDLNQIYIDTWGVGEIGDSYANPKHRLVRTLFFYRDKATNPFGRPISGLSAMVDLTKKQVVDVIDRGVIEIPKNAEDFFDGAWIKSISGGVLRRNVEHEAVKKSSAVSIKGNEISWEGFRFLASINPREGLVIGQLGLEEKGRVRPILYRGSLSEMVVPYGDPDKDWSWRCAFDEGDYGLGTFTNSLKLGFQVPINSETMDAIYADNEGKIQTIKNAIAVYERGPTLLWSHYDEDTGKIAAQMGKELVVMSIFTISNYDYGIQWVFNQSGEIKVNVLLTGILAVKALDLPACARCEAMASGEKASPKDRFGTVVGPNVLAVIHQHFFNFRLDFSVDGVKNSVVEIDYIPIKNSKENPAGNAFTYAEEILATEKQAPRNTKPSVGRHWWIINPNVRNSLGHFSGYMLEPRVNAKAYEQTNSQVLKRAPFLHNQLWVTKFAPNEMHAAGTYPNQNSGAGLPEWTKRNASIVNEDIVVWYTVGVDHLPRAEDWPVMPTVHAGFTLRPKGFFARNPSLNVVNVVR